jgi:hypothetical protein
MKYYFDTNFHIVTKNRYINLLKYLFSHYDQFVAEVVGDFEQSAYRNLLYPTASYDYYYYRRNRASQYKEAKRKGHPYEIKELISFEEFKRNFQAPVINAELSSLSLFISGLEDIINHNCIVHDKKGMCFKTEGNGFQLFRSTISAIIQERFPNLLEGKHNRLPHCKFHRTGASSDHSELMPVYVFIFKKLKKKKLDFNYQKVSSKVFSKFMDVIDKNIAEMKIQEILNSDVESTLDDDDIERAIYNREQSDKYADVKQMIEIMKPPVIVGAYYSVYGALPANYPFLED